MIKDTSNGGRLSEARIKEMAEEHGIYVSFPQKSMDDDNPTVPVNRGVAGVYMPEPNEKTRARVGLVQAAERYIATTNCDFDVFDISANNGNVYQLRITRMR